MRGVADVPEFRGCPAGKRADARGEYLEQRAKRPDCTECVAPARYGVSADPGDGRASGTSLAVPVTLKISEEAYGTESGGVSFVVNDPARPFREVRLGADVY